MILAIQARADEAGHMPTTMATSEAAQSSLSEVVGRVGDLEGDVRINGDQAKRGQALLRGSVIETGKGKVTLLLGTDSVIHLDEDSRFKVSEFSVSGVGGTEAAALDLSYGKTRALIRSGSEGRKRFRIRTRTATLGVRGTQVVIEAPEDISKPQTFVTLDGLADLYLPAERPKDVKAALEMSDASLNDVRKFRKIEVPAASGVTDDPALPPAQIPVQKIDAEKLRKFRREIGLPPRQTATSQDVNDIQKDKPAQKRRALLRLIRTLSDQYTYDPVLDGGLRLPVSVKATTDLKP
ncbi:MAG TPA: FecR domain-containing protein [Bdellovibrionota bacterium]|jgi:hypothetical protein|nr:FecR domain-containing protein [Bdellovibrionota bacterium]